MSTSLTYLIKTIIYETKYTSSVESNDVPSKTSTCTTKSESNVKKGRNRLRYAGICIIKLCGIFSCVEARSMNTFRIRAIKWCQWHDHWSKGQWSRRMRIGWLLPRLFMVNIISWRWKHGTVVTVEHLHEQCTQIQARFGFRIRTHWSYFITRRRQLPVTKLRKL